MEKILNSAAMLGFAGIRYSKTANLYCFSKLFLLQTVSLQPHSVKKNPLTNNVTTYSFWNQDRNTAFSLNNSDALVYHELLSNRDAIGRWEVEFPKSVEINSYVYLN